MGKGKFRREIKHHVTKFNVALANMLIIAVFEPALFYLAGESSTSIKYTVGAGLGLIIIVFVELFLVITKKKIGFVSRYKSADPVSSNLISDFSWVFYVMIIPVLFYILISLVFNFGMSGTPIGVACTMWMTIRTLEIRQWYTSRADRD